MAESIKLTVERCKELCSDFRLSTQKKACIHVHNEMCALPSHFVCELVRYKRKLARDAEIKDKEAISSSRVNLLEACPRAYYFRYEAKLQPEEESPWNKMGDAFGVARARLDSGLEVEPSLLRSDLLPYEAAKVRAAIRLYRHSTWLASKVGYSPQEVDCEVEVFFEAHDFHWLGYIDAASKDRSRLWEWKFAKTDYDILSLARQSSIYFSGVPEAREMTVAVFRKPGQRPKKNESVDAYENRIAADMTTNPDDWIRVFTFSRDEWNANVLRHTAESFRYGLASAVLSEYVPHYSSCYDCDYRSICSDHVGVSTEQIVQIRRKK